MTVFTYCRNIHLSDTDAAGVIYFAKGLSICHEAYEEWLQSIGIGIGEILATRKIALPIVRAEIDFLQPIVCSDRIQVKLDIKELERTKFIVTYTINNFHTADRILARGLTVHVCIDPQTKQRATLPEKILKAIDRQEITEIKKLGK